MLVHAALPALGWLCSHQERKPVADCVDGAAPHCALTMDVAQPGLLASRRPLNHRLSLSFPRLCVISLCLHKCFLQVFGLHTQSTGLVHAVGTGTACAGHRLRKAPGLPSREDACSSASWPVFTPGLRATRRGCKQRRVHSACVLTSVPRAWRTGQRKPRTSEGT